MSENTIFNKKLIRIKTVIEMTGISRSYVYKLVSDGEFPIPIRLIKGGKSVAWLESEIQQWIETRIQERDMEVA